MQKYAINITYSGNRVVCLFVHVLHINTMPQQTKQTIKFGKHSFQV